MESKQQILRVETRVPDGKSGARKLRRAGRVPGILYGHGNAPIPLSIEPTALEKSLRASGRGRNTVFVLEGLGRDALALLHDAESDPVRRNVIHVDFIEVRTSDRVTVNVPVDFQGKAVGVVNGGNVQVVERTIAVICSPLEIPLSIPVDITALDIGDSITMSAVTLPAGVTAITPPRATIVSVKAPKAEVVEAAPGAAAAATEGEAGAPAAGGAAPAADAAGKKADAAGKKAEPDKKAEKKK